MVTIEDRVNLIRLESQQLREYLNTLPSQSWRRPSACHLWRIADVVAHLTWNAECFADIIDRGVRGDTTPHTPEGFPPDGATNRVSLDYFVGQVALARRQALGDQLLPTFNATADQLDLLLGRLGPQDWNKNCNFLTRPRPVHSLITTRVQEVAIHQWDIRSRLDSSAHLTTESLPILMERVGAFVTWAFRPGPKLSDPFRYRFELTGPLSSKNDIVIEGDSVRLEAAGEAPAKGTFRCDTETFVLLMCGRLAVDTAISKGQLAVEGAREVATELGRWFGG